MIQTFFKGIVIGFSIAAPVGPIGLLCIQRTLTGGRLIGLISGFGAASADAIYGMIAAFGLTAVSDVMMAHQFWLRLIGGLFLCYLGARTWRAKPAEQAASVKKCARPLSAYASVFFLTLTNPITILAFAGIFAGVGIGGALGHYGSAALMMAGVFCGSMLWWTILSSVTGLMHGKISPQTLAWINRCAGGIIGAFGLAALGSVFYTLS